MTFLREQLVKVFRQPLIHFLLLGLVLYLIFEATGVRTQDAKTIVVGREELLRHMQFRSKIFDKGRFDRQLSDMTEPERRRLINEYAREEVLHREAKALGLDENDYVIRRRLVQKVEYLAVEPDLRQLSDEEISAYFSAHQQDYYVASTTTFTHVFIRGEGPDAEARAGELLVSLRRREAGFADATSFGDRFAYHRNYVERTEEFVAGHFGAGFAARVFSLEPGAWQGPLTSAYGYHLVYLQALEQGRDARFEEVAGQVRHDAAQARIREQTEKAIKEILATYKIVIEP